MPKIPERIPHLKDISRRSGIPWERVSTQQVSPDTCGCVFEEYKDDNDLATIFFSERIIACPDHAAASPEPGYNAVKAENRRVQDVRRIVESLTARQDGTIQPIVVWDAGTRVVDGIQRAFTFRANNVTLTQAQANSVQAAVNIQLGAGLVTITRA